MSISLYLSKEEFKEIDNTVKTIPNIRRHSTRVNMKTVLTENKKDIIKSGNFEMFYNTFYDQRINDIVDIIYVHVDKDMINLIIRGTKVNEVDELSKSLSVKKVLDKLENVNKKK